MGGAKFLAGGLHRRVGFDGLPGSLKGHLLLGRERFETITQILCASAGGFDFVQNRPEGRIRREHRGAHGVLQLDIDGRTRFLKRAHGRVVFRLLPGGGEVLHLVGRKVHTHRAAFLLVRFVPATFFGMGFANRLIGVGLGDQGHGHPRGQRQGDQGFHFTKSNPVARCGLRGFSVRPRGLIFRLLHRQDDLKGRAGAGHTLKRDIAAVGLDHVFDD